MRDSRDTTPTDTKLRATLKHRFAALWAEAPSHLREVLLWRQESAADTTTWQVNRLARLVYILEHAAAGLLPELGLASIFTPDDIARHPGFAGVEDEVAHEARFLAQLNRRGSQNDV